MTALLPCPFCGGKSTVCKWFWVDGSGRPDTYRASCVFGCGRSSDELTEANAIAAWNRRAAPASPRSLGVSQDEPPPPAEPPVEGWRGIESAPRDGTLIDLWGPHGRWTSARWKAGHWVAFSHGRGTVPVYYSRPEDEFTHWMPIPSPPLSAKDTSEWNSESPSGKTTS